MLERLLLASCGVVFGTACVDPGASFDAFVDRAAAVHRPEPDASADAAACEVHAGDIDGQYLLAISVTLAPTKPIAVLADVTTPLFDGGIGISFDAQPLSAADRKTPVGSKLALGPFPIDSNGTFRADLPGLEVTGAANPVTGGDITANLVLTGSLCGDRRFFCGEVSGNVEKPLPLDLAGSTFTLTKVEAPGAFPARPAIDCVGTLADPL